MTRVLWGVTALSVSLAAAAPAAARQPTERVLVDLRPGASPAFAGRALAAHGARVRHVFAREHVVALEATPAQVAALRDDPAVRKVERDPRRRAFGLASSQLAPAADNGLYGLLLTRAVDVQQEGYSGAGIRACVADTGIDYTHPDIAPNYGGGIDEVDQDSDPWWADDPEEVHATHVAATMLGADNGIGVLGMAPRATLYVARVLGPSGGFASDVMAGVRWLVEQKHCRVVNLSLGGPLPSAIERRFYAELHRKGALIVAAAGNDGGPGLAYPAGYPSVLSVGAVDAQARHAPFSDTGPGLDLSAPGVLVLSAVPAGWGSEASVSAGGEFRALGLEFAGSTAGVSGVFVRCGLGQPGDFPDAVRGNIAVIDRGTLTFADKLRNAMRAGAAAAVVVNNAAGDFAGTLGEEGPWIPAVAVSPRTGAALATRGRGTVVNESSSWAYADGTSQAAPHVSGAAALVWSANPWLTDEGVEHALESTARDLGPAGRDATYGYGLVDAAAAVATEVLGRHR